MRAPRRADRTAPDAAKEKPKMPKRLATMAVSIGAALLLILPAAQASAAPAPWWQIVTGSRPTNLWQPASASMTQEVKGEPVFGFVLAVRVEVGGDTVGCLGAGTLAPFGGPSANELCEAQTGYPASETAAELEAMLEGPYGAGEVEVSGGPAGALPFEVKSAWRPPIEVSVLDTELFGEVLPMGEGVGSKVTSEGSGRLTIALTNLGDAPMDATSTPLEITDELPEGVRAYGVEAVAGFHRAAGPVDCALPSASEVTCSFESELPSYEAIEVEVLVALQGSPPHAGTPGEISVSGGDAPGADAGQFVKVSPESVPFGLESFSMQSEEEGGAPTGQAGAHPFQETITIQTNSGRTTGRRLHEDEGRVRVEQPAVPRNLRVTFPPGLIGNATAVPQCPLQQFLDVTGLINKCPDETAVGVSSMTFIERSSFGLERVAVPAFNLVPQHGELARFGFVVSGDAILVDTSVDPSDEYRITGELRNASQLVEFLGATLTLWGTPGDPRHDSSRGWSCALNESADFDSCTFPHGGGETPFLRVPVTCASPLDYRAEMEPWNVPIGSVIDHASFTEAPLVGCNRLPFDPEITSAPTSKLTENPSGLDFELDMPSSGLGNAAGIAEAQPKKVEVTLPEGMTVNPSEAEGLAVCSPAEYERERFDSAPGEGCPEASKIGSVQASTPLLKEKAEGSLYLATPHDNPFDSLLAVYIVARIPGRGVLVKQPISLDPDHDTGRLVVTAEDVPQLPFSSLKFHFREGGRAPLVTPPRCGTFQTAARFVPYSAQDPDNPAPEEVVTRTASFTIERGVDGGACPPGGVPPFSPGFRAGTLNNHAGSYSPFDMRLIRRDGEQEMTHFSAILPPGVLGSLAGVGKCPDSAIGVAEAKSGHEELASPSCPEDSLIGHSLVGAGVGSLLTYVTGKVYLGGPYHGDPLSVIAVTPVVAGPFDIGTVVVREALTFDPETAEVQIDGAASDPIPHILEGLPTKVRDLRVSVDRPDFIINPTSCAEERVRSTLFGSYLSVLDPSDDRPVDLAARFQAADCASLGFKPDLRLNLKGGTKRGGHPALKAIYTPKKGDANVRGLVVRLPRSTFLDQANIKTICTRAQFAASGGNGEQCPKASRYGFIKAWTPLLEEPLEGPVFLGSSNHKLPDLLFALRGLIDIKIDVRIDSQGGGIRATLEDAPDATLSRVVLQMQGAKKGLIINSRNLCGSKNRANVLATGHNGRQFHAHPVVRSPCGKARHKKNKRHRRR